jgi:hypothetical protein
MGGGFSSTAWMPRILLEKYPKDQIHFFTCVLPNEHPSMWELFDAVEEKLDIKVTYIAYDRTCKYTILPEKSLRSREDCLWTPFDIFEDVKFLGNSRNDPCSLNLKRNVAKHYIKDHYPDATLAIGIHADELERLSSIYDNWMKNGYETLFPLIDLVPYTTERQIELLQEWYGVSLPLYEKSFSHNNCFSGDTRYITREGIKTLKETVGTQQTVLSKGGSWKTASIQSFGNQSLMKLTLERRNKIKEIYVTADHRWIVHASERGHKYVDCLTKDLKQGKRIKNQSTKSSLVYTNQWGGIRPSAFGIAHGIVYGDGTISHTTEGPVILRLCGTKQNDLKKWFPISPTKSVENDTEILDLPRSFKSLPDVNESQSYLLGFLMGYFAADGHVSKRDSSVTLSCAQQKTLETVVTLATRVGLRTCPIKSYQRLGYGKEPTLIYSVTFLRDDLTPEFFLRLNHQISFGTKEISHRVSDTWRIVSVEPTDRVEEVFCAVVEDTHEFTLEDFIATGNCGGACVKAGQRQWALLWYHYPEVYAEWEQRELAWREQFGNHTILKIHRDGEQQHITLKEFRETVVEPQACNPTTFIGKFLAELPGNPPCFYCSSM